jgi:hypothetical protein
MARVIPKKHVWCSGKYTLLAVIRLDFKFESYILLLVFLFFCPSSVIPYYYFVLHHCLAYSNVSF